MTSHYVGTLRTRRHGDPPATATRTCTVDGCRRDAVALSYCHIDAAVLIANRGVLRQRTRRLLEVLATDDDLTGPLAAQAWRDELADAIANVWDAIEAAPDHSGAA